MENLIHPEEIESIVTFYEKMKILKEKKEEEQKKQATTDLLNFMLGIPQEFSNQTIDGNWRNLRIKNLSQWGTTLKALIDVHKKKEALNKKLLKELGSFIPTIEEIRKQAQNQAEDAINKQKIQDKEAEIKELEAENPTDDYTQDEITKDIAALQKEIQELEQNEAGDKTKFRNALEKLNNIPLSGGGKKRRKTKRRKRNRKKSTRRRKRRTKRKRRRSKRTRKK